MSNHGLTPPQMQLISTILRPYARKITLVGLFGSRATGTYRANSDIDLVLYGTLAAREVDRLHSLFEESALPMKVDVVAYDLIDHPPLQAHITAVMQPLFAKGIECDPFGKDGE
jgi:uncharacterized protein